jgi:hypothetical protein
MANTFQQSAQNTKKKFFDQKGGYQYFSPRKPNKLNEVSIRF